MQFKSDALKEAGLPLGTPLNKFQPQWTKLGSGVKPHPRDAEMLTGNRCRCPSCGEYFNSSYAFDQHRTGTLNTPERRCLTMLEMRLGGWKQGPKGHWRSPPSAAGWATRHSRNLG